jgi:cell division protein FtsZ
MERRAKFYDDDSNSRTYKKRPKIYIFRTEDLDNDDIISAVEQTPTYKRTREVLESIGNQNVVGKATANEQAYNSSDIQGVISFV